MKKRIQVTINPELLVEAQRLMQTRKFDNLSNFLEALIRQEWERVGGDNTVPNDASKDMGKDASSSADSSSGLPDPVQRNQAARRAIEHLEKTVAASPSDLAAVSQVLTGLGGTGKTMLAHNILGTESEKHIVIVDDTLARRHQKPAANYPNLQKRPTRRKTDQ